MKRIFKYGMLALGFTLAFVSCAKDEELLFDEEAGVYVEYQDSLEYSFATSPNTVQIDSVLVRYRIVGKASDKDRVVSLVPNAGASAKPGYHYKIGKSVIKAGAFRADVPIYLYRKPGLLDSTVAVTLTVAENSDFKQGYQKKLSYKFTLTDILKKPSNWETTWQTFFGAYSVVKFKFLLEATGRRVWTGPVFPQDSRFMSQKAKNALLEYNQTYGPLIDENKQEVFFP